MIKKITGTDFSINVKLKNGKYFENMDIHTQTIDEEGRTLGFWIKDVYRMYPLSEVEYFELIKINQ